MSTSPELLQLRISNSLLNQNVNTLINTLAERETQLADLQAKLAALEKPKDAKDAKDDPKPS